MAVKIKFVRANLLNHPVRSAIVIALCGMMALVLAVCGSIFGYTYVKYRHIVDERLQKPLFEQTAKIYAAPKELRNSRATERALSFCPIRTSLGAA